MALYSLCGKIALSLNRNCAKGSAEDIKVGFVFLHLGLWTPDFGLPTKKRSSPKSIRSCTLSFFLKLVFVALFEAEHFGKAPPHITLLEMPTHWLVCSCAVLGFSGLVW
jgi:hypothetical protein